MQPQEIRAALYHGPFEDFLIELNEEHAWRKVFGQKSKRAKDQELLLRYFAFRFSAIAYKSPMKGFLNRFMEANRSFELVKPDAMKTNFLRTLTFISDSVAERPFRPVRSLNAAAFDSVMVVVSKHVDALEQLGEADFASKYSALMKDVRFRGLVTRATADDMSVRERFSIAEKYLLG